MSVEFLVPDECLIERVVDVRRLSLGALKPAERRRFRECVEELRVVAVVSDAVLPRYERDEFLVQAVQVFAVRLSSLHSAPFVCGVLQRMTKTFSVVVASNGREEVFSFALKRLNRQDAGDVVVVNEFLTDSLICGEFSSGYRLMEEMCSWGHVVNMTSLFSWYVEVMVRCFIVFHRDLWSGMEGLLERKVWYNTEEVLCLFGLLQRLVMLYAERGRAVTAGEAVRVNGELKRLYEEIGQVR